MSVADDREQQTIDLCKTLHAQTGESVTISAADFEFLRNRGKLRSNGHDVVRTTARIEGTDILVQKR